MASPERGIPHMDPKLADPIGILRHQIISPVLMETGQAQMIYFRSVPFRSVPFRRGAGSRRSWQGAAKIFAWNDEGLALHLSIEGLSWARAQDPLGPRQVSSTHRRDEDGDQKTPGRAPRYQLREVL